MAVAARFLSASGTEIHTKIFPPASAPAVGAVSVADLLDRIHIPSWELQLLRLWKRVAVLLLSPLDSPQQNR